WGGPPAFDERCFEALTRLESMLADRDVQLVLVSFPPSPAWRAEFDPDGEALDHFETRLLAALQQPDTRFLPSGTVAVDPSLYFDAIHFRWQGAQKFSSVIADRLATRPS